jgi:TldD protein
VRDVAEVSLDGAVGAGASYADARAVPEESETVAVQDQRVEYASRSTGRGVGIRVLLDGSWGFAATARLDRAALLDTARRAVAIARASGTLQRRPVSLTPTEVHSGRWATPFAVDPFAVPVTEKLDLLLAATAAAARTRGLSFTRANLDAWRTRKWFMSSEGADLEQELLQVGGGVTCVAVGEREVQTRSFPNSFRGYCGSGGWEDIVALNLAGKAPRYAEEAVALLRAPELPSELATVVIDSNQLALQVHESVGHALELDRILGYEAAYAGTSFVSPRDVGTLRYGSEVVNLTLDTTTPKALGTYGYDDEGVPATTVPLVREGVLRALLTSRETAPLLGDEARGNGTMRADSWASIPLIRMTNLHLEAGEGTLEELIADTGRGWYLTANRSWSIDDKRVNFAFGCEAAHEIRDGRLGRLFRNPTYGGRTTDFWRSCDAIAGRDAWRVHGIPNCGKGQPHQVARVAHGASPARFRDVQVGVR